MNTDTNPCWYIATGEEEHCEAAKALLSGAIMTSGVMEELIYRLYWSAVYEQTSPTLEMKDRLRRTTVNRICNLYDSGYLGGDDIRLIRFALDVFKYRRLDWVDSYLIARQVVCHEAFATFDTDMTKTAQEIMSLGGKIPVISSYTLSVDNLPAHVVIRPEDRKKFIKAGLLTPPKNEQGNEIPDIELRDE